MLGGCEFTKAVSKYDSLTNTFDETLPSLILATNYASAVYLDGVIYVACGVDSNNNYISTMEKLETRDPSSQWKLIHIPESLELGRKM